MPTSVERQPEDLLRRLALHDEAALGSIFGPSTPALDGCELSDRTNAQVRLAALVALEAAPASYQWAVGVALAAGVTEDEIVGVVVSVAPVVGAARVHSAAAALVGALGYEPPRG
jgi:alkylhydroperoxidase/carboxymuconolactone decarboxylase family protein YurZ